MLEAINISCEKGYTALFEGLNFQLNAGDLVQITGANGSGKTSLLRILAGLSQPETGRVLWNNQSIHKERSLYQSALCYLGHSNGLKGELTAEENLNAYCSLNTVNADFSTSKALDTVGLCGHEHTPAFYLSAGQKRRLAWARLLASNANIWLLDEPATAIDSSGVHALLPIIDQHVQKGGIAVFTSHQTLEFAHSKTRALSLHA